jgi:phage/plasmid-like protein (TIGR03299 family)
MSHEIETMAYAGALPWHGLGIPVEENLTPQQMMEVAGCDWTVSKRPMAFSTAALEAEEVLIETGELKPIVDRYALVRDIDNQFLDIVGKTYQPTQNKDAFEFFDAFVKETKLKMHTAGSLCQGKYVWALAKNEGHQFSLGPDKDQVESYILLVSPHQFGKALIAQQTTVRVVCANTLALALNEKGLISYRMPHTKIFNNEAKLAAGKILGLANESFEEFKRHVAVIADKKLVRVEAVDFFSELLGLSKEKMLAANDDGLPKSRSLNQFMDAFEGNAPGAELSGTKGTLWGAVNAVTYVMDHISVRNKELAFRDNLFGYRGDLKRKALNQALKWAA